MLGFNDLHEHMRVDTLLKDVTHWCVVQLVPSSGDELATPNLESDVLTTRPTRLLSQKWVGWTPFICSWKRESGCDMLALLALLSTSSVAVAFYGKGRNKTARTLEYFELNKRLLQMTRNSLCKLKTWSALINADFTSYCRSRFLSCKEKKTLQTRLVRWLGHV